MVGKYEDAGTPEPTASSRDELVRAVAREESVLARLESELLDARVRLANLQAELARDGLAPGNRASPSSQPQLEAPQTSADKVRLFRSLFRGREDVVATRFVSRKTGKPGYAPACRNKFVKGVCELPKVKCGACPNQDFIPPDDLVVLGHLKGRHVLGVYPLLPDETCWFLAVDFDKSTWREDVRAFWETCRRIGLPVAVERSRSGNGAHAWFFFSSPVSASAARKMGCYLLTETMGQHHQLSMDSYDRLFPSQDTMPRGGFGNLIALPLQREPRREGNSVFLDESLQPLADDQQWTYLASIPRIKHETVDAIASEATRHDSVVGVRTPEGDEEGSSPWTQPPSRRPRPVAVMGPVPPRVRVVLGQRVFVEKNGLPSPPAAGVCATSSSAAPISSSKRVGAAGRLWRHHSTAASICPATRGAYDTRNRCASAMLGLLLRGAVATQSCAQPHDGNLLAFGDLAEAR